MKSSDVYILHDINLVQSVLLIRIGKQNVEIKYI